MADSGLESSLKDALSTTSQGNFYDEGQLFLNETDILNLEDPNTPATAEGNAASQQGLLLDDRNDDGVPDPIDDVDGETADQELQRLADDEEDEEEEKKELSPGGVLDEETIGQGLSKIGRSADGSQQVFLHLSIPGFSLHDISLLDEFIHLQKVEIPYNELTDLSSLGNMPYLLELDASHNQLTTVLDFKPPRNLKDVNLSFNQIEEMGDLSGHSSLNKLNLDNNQIIDITGLSQCKRLQWLSLAHNNIDCIQGLDNLPIKYINLRYNKLKGVENLDKLTYLQMIDLSGNKIRSLQGLEGHDYLDAIDVQNNEVIDVAEIQYVEKLPMLRTFNLLQNPIQELPDYRLSILYQLPKLIDLDRRKVDEKEKVSSVNMFSPAPEVVAARDHIMHIVYSFLQPNKVLECTLPSIHTPYPMLVLVGPEGSGKKDLAMKLVEEFPEYFGYGVVHTTRKPFLTETPDKEYHYVSIDDFEEIIRFGRFLYTYHQRGEWYGLTIDSIENVAREGLATVVSMELEGMLTLKNTYFEPRYVLIMPMSKEAHSTRLQTLSVYTEPEIDQITDKCEVYARYNQDQPGFFDMFINSDDIAEAYRLLRRLVMDYLGISVPTPEASNKSESIPPQSGDINKIWARVNLQPPMSAPAVLGESQMKALTPLDGTRGIVEEESVRKRQSAAKDAITGQQPSFYDQIASKTPQTADKSERSKSVQTADPTGEFDALPRTSPDSSIDNSRASTSLSNLGRSGSMSPASQGGEQGNPSPPISQSSSIARPGSGRPGSERLKVLPPIIAQS